jgi:hypothetical protein
MFWPALNLTLTRSRLLARSWRTFGSAEFLSRLAVLRARHKLTDEEAEERLKAESNQRVLREDLARQSRNQSRGVGDDACQRMKSANGFFE